MAPAPSATRLWAAGEAFPGRRADGPAGGEGRSRMCRPLPAPAGGGHRRGSTEAVTCTAVRTAGALDFYKVQSAAPRVGIPRGSQP